MEKQRSTTRRLLLGFGAQLTLFALAMAASLYALNEARESLRRIREEEQQVRQVLQVANALRDQYAHEAHMVILGNDSHLPMYEQSLRKLEMLYNALEATALPSEAARALESIRNSSHQLDRLFRAQVLPEVQVPGQHDLREVHAASLALVLRVQAQADQLAATLAQDIARREGAATRTRTIVGYLIMGLFGIAVVFAFLLGLFVQRKITQPLAALDRTARKLAEGDLEARLQLPGGDELARLGEQLGEMAAKISTQQQTLVARERQAAVGRLAAGVAHEINNPLGVILGYAKILQREADDETGGDLQAILEETQHAQEIVRGLMDLSRPWSRRREPLQLGELFRETAQRLEESGEALEASYGVEGEATVLADPAALRQVAHNLLKNAAEANPGGKVRVQVQVTEAVELQGATNADPACAVQVVVEDEGPGFPEELEGRVFEPFATAKEGGTGLGLAVSRSIVEAHGGTIGLAPVAPGAGGRVVLCLPEAH